MRKLFITIGVYSIAAGLLLLNSCKDKKCEETWTIKGRLLNGTTLQPIINVWFSATLYDLNHNNKATNQTPVGQGITDDSGYFSIEYPCKEKTFEKIDFETLAPYGGYVRDNVKFEKHFNRTFYYSTQGSCRIILKEKTPLNGKKLYVGFGDIDLNTGKPFWRYVDSFSSNVPNLWQTYRGKKGGGMGIYYVKDANEFQKILSTFITDDDKYIQVSITGDPIIDSVVVNY